MIFHRLAIRNGSSFGRAVLVFAIVIEVASTLASAPQGEPKGVLLHPGDRVLEDLPAGDPWNNVVDFEIVIPREGAYVIEVRSLHFDAQVAADLLAPDGSAEPAGEDDDGGLATDSRLVIESGGPAHYVVHVRQTDYPYCGTSFELSIAEGGSIQGPGPEEADDTPYWDAVEAISPSCRLRSLLTRGRGLWDSGRYQETKPVVDEARAMSDTVLKDDLVAANALYHLATLSQWLGEDETARGFFERVLAIYERQFGPDHPRVAQSHNNLGILLRDMGLFRESRMHAGQAVAIQEKVDPEDFNMSAYVGNLGWVLNALGFPEEAREQAERALAISERTLGPDHPWTADRLEDLADALLDLGEYGRARDAVERALSIREASQGTDHAMIARTLVRLARYLSNLGSREEAAETLRKALHLTEAAFGADSSTTALLLTQLAAASPPGEARPLLERALANVERTEGPDNPWSAKVLNALGRVLVGESLIDEAMTRLTRALKIEQEQFGASHLKVEETLSVLAEAHVKRAAYDEAQGLLRRCLAILEGNLGPEHVLLADRLVRLAEIELRTGQSQIAFEHALRGETIAREHLRLTSRALSERRALQYAGVRSTGLDIALSLVAGAPADPVTTTAAWGALIRSRGLVLDEMAARHRSTTRSTDPQVADLASDLAAARTRLATLVVRGPGDQAPEGYRDLIEEARQDREKLEEALASRDHVFRGELARDRAGFEELRATLGPGDALVSFARYERSPLPSKSAATRQIGNDPDHSTISSYLAFVFVEGAPGPAVLSLGPAAVVEPMVSRWVEEARHPPTEAGAERTFRDVAQRLRKSIWDLLVPHLRGAKRIFIVPDGALNLLNFYALVHEDGRYLLEDGIPIHYLTVERI